jgi:hypothetical protein
VISDSDGDDAAGSKPASKSGGAKQQRQPASKRAPPAEVISKQATKIPSKGIRGRKTEDETFSVSESESESELEEVAQQVGV